jgi:translation initiation factor 1
MIGNVNMSLVDQPFFHSSSFGELDESGEKQVIRSNVHIRVLQRNSKKSITMIEGLAEDLDLRKILKALKKTLNTSGFLVMDDEYGQIINIHGDQRKAVADFFIKYHICTPSEIKIHGF